MGSGGGGVNGDNSVNEGGASTPETWTSSLSHRDINDINFNINNNGFDGGGSSHQLDDDDDDDVDVNARGRVDLTAEEVTTLCCGVLFFVSFFVAMYAQVQYDPELTSTDITVLLL